MIKKLKPIYDHDSYSVGIQKAIYKELHDSIFAQLFLILGLPKNVKNNKTTQLEDALRSGKIKYQNGYFFGKLNASLSKQLRAIGAEYFVIRQAYGIDRDYLPQDIINAIRAGEEQSKLQLKEVEKYLNTIQDQKLKPINFFPHFGDTINKLDYQFHQTTRKITSQDIAIPIAHRFKDQLEEDYTKNLNMYVQDWHDEQVLRLKEQVYKNVEQGFRADNLIDSIVAERGVSERKAKFLARQETSLMVSAYRQIRYKEIGVTKYEWSTSHDIRVRHDHRELNGRIFSYDRPPITDTRTGARNNPGQDFHCRCLDIPVLTNRSLIKEQDGN